jgi:hypothetical protein
MHECFWIRGETQGQVENVNLKKRNLNLATNARMCWIRCETQGQVENVSLRNGIEN